MDISQVRDRVAVLFQDFVKYFLPARENISMGRWERSEDEQAVRQAAARAGAQAFIEALPHGYDTYLGPQFFGGSDLSGGQWQRVALARAFFRDARLVILDEPTAALDARAEAALFRAVRDLFAGRSVLLISHRFATVRLADHIYVLNKGRVVEHGNHRRADGPPWAVRRALHPSGVRLWPPRTTAVCRGLTCHRTRPPFPSSTLLC